MTTCTLAFIYLFRNEHFYFVRNMFMVAMGLALVGYVVVPDRAAAAACPSWVHGLGVGLHGVVEHLGVNALFNPYAAVPSMHVGFALMLGVPMIRDGAPPLGEGRCGRLPADRHVVVVVTANHWIFDAVTGRARRRGRRVAAQTLFARARPASVGLGAAAPGPRRAGR